MFAIANPEPKQFIKGLIKSFGFEAIDLGGLVTVAGYNRLEVPSRVATSSISLRAISVEALTLFLIQKGSQASCVIGLSVPGDLDGTMYSLLRVDTTRRCSSAGP